MSHDLNSHHHEEHFLESAALRDLVIGMSDGLTVPFALAAGLTGTAFGSGVILTAGFSEIVAGAIAMGLGGYLSGRSAVEHYSSELKREYAEVEHLPEKEKEEVREILRGLGMDELTQKLFVESLAKDKHAWVQFMMRFELGLEKPDPAQAYYSAVRIGGGYLLGGVIPLFPYFFTRIAFQGLIFSSLITAISLFFFGYVKSRITGQKPVLGAIKVVAVGGVAAGSAFWIAKWAERWIASY